MNCYVLLVSLSVCSVTMVHSAITINMPGFVAAPQTIKQIPESQTAATAVGTITATVTPAEPVYYIFVVSPSLGHSKFTFDETTGDVSTVADPGFDFETTPKYTFTVTAFTADDEQTDTFDVDITDVNERPVITNLPDAIKLDENDSGARSIFTFVVTDPDPGDTSFTYSFVVTPPGTETNRFELNKVGATSSLWLKGPPDDPTPGLNYEEYRDYNLSITAIDPNGLTSVPKYLHIEIRDINEAPVFTDTAATASIYEESPIGTTLVSSIGPPRALDPDILKNDTVTYIMGGKYSDYFKINTYNQEAVITLAKRLDREAVNVPIAGTFTLFISAIDRLSLRQNNANTFELTVTVIDINDHPTVCNPTMYQGSIVENSPIDTSVLTITCQDSDDVTAWPITYRVNNTGLPEKYFYFPAAASNQLSARYPMDLEQGSLLTFRVDVVQGAPYDSSTTTVSVEISVVGTNDNRPNMSQSFYNFDFRYDAAINTQIGQVSASDADVTSSVVTLDWVYAVTEFFMQTTTGIITTKTTFSADQKFVYHAIAKDNDVPPDYSTTSPVRIDTFDPTLYLVDFQVVQPLSYFTEARKQEFEDAISSACPPCVGRISSLEETPGSPTTTTLRVYALTDSSTESYANIASNKTYIAKETMMARFAEADQETPSSAVALPGFFNFPVIKVSPTRFGLTFLQWLLYTPEGNATLALAIMAALASLIGTLVYLWRTGALPMLFRLLMACDVSNLCKDCCKPAEPQPTINHPKQGGDFNVFEFRYRDEPLAPQKYR